MVKRVGSAVLWFFAVAWGWNYIAMLSGAPSIFGLLLGAAVGAFVWADPLHRLWPVTQNAPARRSPAPAAMSAAIQTRI